MGLKIAIYARVSRDDGTQDPQNQIGPLRDFAKALNGEIVMEYVDLASGSTVGNHRNGAIYNQGGSLGMN